MKLSQENTLILKYLGIVLFLTVLVALVMPRKVDWSPSFEKDSDTPYGSKILFDELSNIFSQDSIKVNTEPFYNDLGNRALKDHNLIIVANDFKPDSLERAQLYNFVRYGNNAFISANEFHWSFRDSLKFETDFSFSYERLRQQFEDENIAQLYFHKYPEADQDYSVKANLSMGKFDSKYEPEYFVQDSLNEDRKAFSRIGYYKQSAHGDEEQTNFIRIQYGKGNFYLHQFPYAFTNYGILKNENHQYIAQCLSYLPQQKTIWDEYYKPKPFKVAGGQTPLNVLFSSTALRWAYFIGLTTLLLFMIFYAKRRQRIIPVIEEYKNESLDFTKSIASLYFQKHNNADLAQKKARYFRDYVSRKFYLKHFSVDQKGLDDLVGKSNYDREQLADLFNWVNKGNEKRVSDRELIEISKRLNHFYRDN